MIQPSEYIVYSLSVTRLFVNVGTFHAFITEKRQIIIYDSGGLQSSGPAAQQWAQYKQPSRRRVGAKAAKGRRLERKGSH
jgi:hypothetical protein